MLREASEDVVDAGWFPANELIDHPAAKQSFVSRLVFCTVVSSSFFLSFAGIAKAHVAASRR